jgi:hypothetical protein
LQIQPDKDIFALMVFWNKWMMKYTHYPEAENAQHPVNRHWFVFRREASVTIDEERKLGTNVALSLLFGEAKRNLLTKRYVCTQMEAATIAGLQLQISYGDYDSNKCKPGYLAEDSRLEQLLPIGMADKMRPSQWEEIITVQYKSFLGTNVSEARLQFLEFVRKMHCYGCSVFPVCSELPPSGFFEYRTQNWFLGAGPNGIVVMDFETQKYIHVLPWGKITWYTGSDQFHLVSTKNGKAKEIILITPQHLLIENLCAKLKYKWAKETLLLPRKGKSISELNEVVVHKNNNIKKSKALSIDNMKRPMGSFEHLKTKATILQKSIDRIAQKFVGGSAERVSQEQIQNAKKSSNSIVSEDKMKNFIPETMLPTYYQASSAPNSPRVESRKSHQPVKNTPTNLYIVPSSPTPNQTVEPPTALSSASEKARQYSPRVKAAANRAGRGKSVRQTNEEKDLLKELGDIYPTVPREVPTLQINFESVSARSSAIVQKVLESDISIGTPEERPKLLHSQSIIEEPHRSLNISHVRSSSASPASGSLGTYVKAGRGASQNTRKSGVQVNKRSSVLFGFDDHLGGIGPTQLIDKRDFTNKNN